MLMTAMAIQPLFFWKADSTYSKASANKTALPAIRDHVIPLFNAKSTMVQTSMERKLRMLKP